MYFVLFSNCIPVRGHTRSIICDLQRNKTDFIPNSLFEILSDKENNSIELVKEKYQHEYDETIDEYFDFLIQNEYIFFTENPELYPELNKQWYYPFAISNAIIDIDIESPSVINSLEWLQPSYCKNVQIRFFRPSDINEIQLICSHLHEWESDIQFLQIILPYFTLSSKNLSTLYTKYPRLSNLSFYAAPEDVFIKPVSGNRGYTVYSSRKINSCLDCGVIDTQKFAINIQNFTESLQFNSCLNKKVSIDVNGQIKNCPSMKSSFGTIETISINDVLKNSNFTKLWKIKKDEVEKCKDCEFRYICTDCRAYIEDPSNLYSKPLKCGYNPYTTEWDNWAEDKSKIFAKSYYGLNEIQNGF